MSAVPVVSSFSLSPFAPFLSIENHGVSAHFLFAPEDEICNRANQWENYHYQQPDQLSMSREITPQNVEQGQNAQNGAKQEADYKQFLYTESQKNLLTHNTWTMIVPRS